MKIIYVVALTFLLAGCSVIDKATMVACSLCSKTEHLIEAPTDLSMSVIEQDDQTLICLPEEDMGTFLIYVMEMEHELGIEVE